MRSDSGFSRRLLTALSALLFAGVAGAASPVLAQEGAVTGRVTAAGSGNPLSGAQVFVAGTNVGTISGDDGSYRLTGVPTGEQTVRVRMIGYQPASQTVSVSAGQTSTANFSISVSAVDLQEVVVTATGEQQMRSIGHAVGSISADSLVDTAPVRSFEELLAGRSPGVSVQFTGGTVGSGTKIRVRGASSLAVSNEPIVYVDGTRVNVNPTNLTVGTGGQETGALNISPENIESVEVLKGASAATLYGTEAANGVIRVQTKSGAGVDQGTRWRFWAEGGLQTEPNEYPANWAAVGQDGGTCPLTSAAAGLCTQAEMQTFNLLENQQTTPFSTGHRYQTGGSARGQVEGINFFSSGQYEFSQGVYGSENELSDISLRGNFGGQLAENINMNVNTGYESRDVVLPQNDNNLFGIIPNALLGSASEDGWLIFSPEQINRIDTRHEVEQFTGSANLDWTPTDWMTVHATGGMDVSNNKDQQLFPVGAIPFGRTALGSRESNSILNQNYTGEGFIRTNLPVNDAIRSRTTLGAQYFVEMERSVFAFGEEIVPGTNSVSTAATTTASEATSESRTLGIFLQQRFAWENRVFVTGGLRVDDNSAFGTDFGRVWYPSANVSWVVSDEPWFNAGDWLGELRLRGAFGQSGNQPGTTDAVRYLEGVAVTSPAGSDAIGVTFDGGNLGNQELEPERTTEYEGGFEASVFGGRLTLSGTYYHSETSDVLVQRTVAPSLGVTDERFVNLAQVRNEGVEGQIGALLLNLDDLRFNLSLTGAYNDNTLVELGENVSPISLGFAQRHAEGRALGAYWDEPIQSFSDENGDGIISPAEVTVGDTLAFIDQSSPPAELSASPTLTFFDLVRVNGLLEARLGHSLHNNTASFRCGQNNSRFRHDPDSPLQKQAACVATAFHNTESGFVQEADFLRLREVSVNVSAPRAWAQRLLGANALSLTLSGRNLGLWTEYDGIDPEVNQFGAENFSSSSFLTQPPLRYWNARINVSF